MFYKNLQTSARRPKARRMGQRRTVAFPRRLTGRPPRNPETKEPLTEAIHAQLQEPKRFMRNIVDPRARDWDAKKWRRLAVIARRCAEERVSERSAVADVVDEVDSLAGRSGSRSGTGARKSGPSKTQGRHIHKCANCSAALVTAGANFCGVCGAPITPR